MVVAVRTVFIALIKLLDIFPEALFALLTSKYHLQSRLELMRFAFSVTFCAVEPLPAAR